MNAKRSSSPHQIRSIILFMKPSYVSCVLVFVCAFLWVKNEAEHKHLVELEDQWTKLQGRCRQEMSSKERLGTRPKLSGGNSSKHFSAFFNQRKRRDIVDNETGFPGLNFNMTVIFEKLKPADITLCNSTGDVCPAGRPGPPGIPGVRGQPGDSGARGEQGYTGFGGRTGREGIPGIPGLRGPKGYPGAQGPRGPRGPPGSSQGEACPPRAMVSPTEQTGYDGDGADIIFYCTVAKNVTAKIEWRFKTKKLLAGGKYLFRDDGALIIKNVENSDEGEYICSATNAAGTSEASGYLFVRVTCECWRSRSRKTWGANRLRHNRPGDGVDSIYFQTDRDVVLQGYRLWGVFRKEQRLPVTIYLYRNLTLLAKQSGTYLSKPEDKSFAVYFSRRILLRAGVRYTATSKITLVRKRELYLHYFDDGMENVSCSSGVNVTFATKVDWRGQTTTISSGQLPAFIFRTLKC